MALNERYPIYAELVRRHTIHCPTTPSASFRSVLEAMVDAGEAQALEIHPAAGTSQSNAYHVLKRMIRLGVVTTRVEYRPGRPARFYAITDFGLQLAAELKGSS